MTAFIHWHVRGVPINYLIPRLGALQIYTFFVTPRTINGSRLSVFFKHFNVNRKMVKVEWRAIKQILILSMTLDAYFRFSQCIRINRPA